VVAMLSHRMGDAKPSAKASGIAEISFTQHKKKRMLRTRARCAAAVAVEESDSEDSFFADPKSGGEDSETEGEE